MKGGTLDKFNPQGMMNNKMKSLARKRIKRRIDKTNRQKTKNELKDEHIY